MFLHPFTLYLTLDDKKTRKRGSVFMVTPYMDHDLAGLLENPSVRLKVPHIKSYMKQLLQGTAYLHKVRPQTPRLLTLKMKILHRDMKVANLLINNQGILKIADFGLARTYEESPPQRGKPAELPKRDYTNCVVTRWYRPPELLLGERRYGPSVDMWGVGCVFAEMMRTKPLIEGRSDLDQLVKIFRLCGSPTRETMPGYDTLPGIIDDVKVTFTEHYERILEKEMHDFLIKIGVAQITAKLAVNLLSQLLVLDPLKRISAVDALHHEYFTTTPLPSRPADLPVYEASHELTRRKRELRARAPRGAHQVNELENRHDDRRKRIFEGDMPSAWGGGSGMSREDSGRGFRRDEAFRSGRGDSWIASRDRRASGDRERDRDRDRDRERRRSRSPPKEIKLEPEVKYGRR
jgi:serine/threonine-protein kinase BUR1